MQRQAASECDAFLVQSVKQVIEEVRLHHSAKGWAAKALTCVRLSAQYSIMSELWPLDVKVKLDRGPIEALRPFRCLLLMPFESRFNAVGRCGQDNGFGNLSSGSRASALSNCPKFKGSIG